MTDGKKGGVEQTEKTERIQSGRTPTNDGGFSESPNKQSIRDTVPPPPPLQDKKNE